MTASVGFRHGTPLVLGSISQQRSDRQYKAHLQWHRFHCHVGRLRQRVHSAHPVSGRCFGHCNRRISSVQRRRGHMGARADRCSVRFSFRRWDDVDQQRSALSYPQHGSISKRSATVELVWRSRDRRRPVPFSRLRRNCWGEQRREDDMVASITVALDSGISIDASCIASTLDRACWECYGRWILEYVSCSGIAWKFVMISQYTIGNSLRQHGGIIDSPDLVKDADNDKQ